MNVDRSLELDSKLEVQPVLRRFLMTTLFVFGAAGGIAAQPAYKNVGSVGLGTPDRWDYVAFDPGSRRVYIAHGDRVTVVDGGAGTVLGQVEGIAGGTHGTAVAASLQKGFTDDGRAGVVVPFDLKSLKIGSPIRADDDADAMVYDPASGHLFVIGGDPGTITVIDPRAERPIARIKGGEKLEFAVSDGAGSLYVAGEANGDVLRVDTRLNKVVAHWPAADCKSPHGLALDDRTHRLFLGCVNSEMIVLDSLTGEVLSTLSIGRGSDAIAFDPTRNRIFSSNGADGTITVYQQTPRNSYSLLEPIPTAISARTMAVDPETGRLFVAVANVDASPTPGGRPKIQPGTLRLLMFDPAS